MVLGCQRLGSSFPSWMLLTELRRRFLVGLMARGFYFWSPEYIPGMTRDEMTGAMEKVELVPRACLQMFALQLRVTTPYYNVSKEETEDSMLLVCFILFDYFVCTFLFPSFFFHF